MKTELIISIANLIFFAFNVHTSRSSYYITKDKLRLDLYNRRFDIYTKVVDYSLQFRFPTPPGSLCDDKSVAFIKAFRESLFLFESDSGIYEYIEELKHLCSKINTFYQDPENSSLNLCQIHTEQLGIEETLKCLEQALLPYLKMNHIKRVFYQFLTRPSNGTFRISSRSK